MSDLDRNARVAERSREARLRRAAVRQGLTLRKSRRRDPRALDFGRYWLIRGDETVVSAVLGDPDVLGAKLGVTLDEVEAYLTGGGDDA